MAEAGGRALLVGRGHGRGGRGARRRRHRRPCAASSRPTRPAAWAARAGAAAGRRSTWSCWPTRPTAATWRRAWPTCSTGRCWPARSRCSEDGATVAREGGLLMEDVVVDGPVRRHPAAGRAGRRARPVAPSCPPSRSSTSTRSGGRGGSGRRRVDAERDRGAPARPGHHGPGRGAAASSAAAPGSGPGGHGPARSTWPTRLGCSIGGTRVVTDWGWLPFERQIGTTGVIVHPELYLAFGISGAVQHVAGLGDPAHVIAVNTDASCPMMSHRRPGRGDRRAGPRRRARARLGAPMPELDRHADETSTPPTPSPTST